MTLDQAVSCGNTSTQNPVFFLEKTHYKHHHATGVDEFDRDIKSRNVQSLLDRIGYDKKTDVLIEFGAGLSPSIPQGFVYGGLFKSDEDHKILGKNLSKFPQDCDEGKFGEMRKIVVIYNALPYIFHGVPKRSGSPTEEEVETLKSASIPEALEIRSNIFYRIIGDTLSALSRDDHLIIVEETEWIQELAERLASNGYRFGSEFFSNQNGRKMADIFSSFEHPNSNS
jgi:hypothetical protein